MLRLDLGPDELAATRFACSALQETVASLRVLDDPTGHTMHLPWYRDVAGRAARLELGLLRALVPADGYSPDFISPPPNSPLPDLDADLARVAATPTDRVRTEIAELFGSDPPPVVAELLADAGTRAHRAQAIDRAHARGDPARATGTASRRRPRPRRRGDPERGLPARRGAA